MNNLDNWDNIYTPYQGIDPITTMMSSFTISQNSTNLKSSNFKQSQLDKSYETAAEENSSDDCGPHSLLCNDLDVFTAMDHLSYDFPIENRSHTQTFSSSSSPLSSTDQNIFSPAFLPEFQGLRSTEKFYNDKKISSNVTNYFRNQFTFDTSQCSKVSDSTLVALDGQVTDEKDHELEVLDILKEVRENSSEYSRKVFIGGVPEGMSASELCDFFMRFGEVKVDWPHRKQCDDYPKGYAFLIYTSPESVPAVVESCAFFQGRLCIQMEDSAMRPKTVQVRPWRNADRLWKDGTGNVDAITARYSVFLGGVPRTATACQLANLINGYIGNVVAVNIEVDIETEYPKGAARVIFSKRESYITAIAKRHIGIFSSESQKEMEMKPFLEENMNCEHCNKSQTRNFCAELRCLLYICDKCWPVVHKNHSTHEHKPMQKGSFFGKTACADEIRKVSRRVSSSSKEVSDSYKERRGCELTYPSNNFVFQENFGHGHSVENKLYLNPENLVDYSRKVFVGGLPEGLTADEICEFFSVFGHVTVDWPHRERSPHMPRGYAFLVFGNVESVRRLISRCISSPGKLCLKMTFPDNYVEKIVQIRPWCKADRFWMSGKYRGSERYAIFMGGVPRTSTAADLAAFLFQEIGEVLSVAIEVENSTEYPKGAARAVFANREQYVYAIRLSQIAITSVDQQKTVELKPYLEESMMCEGCGQVDTRNFCADLDCLVYLCECCWEYYHSEPFNQTHKPMLKGAFFPSRSINMQIDDFHAPDLRPEWEYQTRNYSRTSQNCDGFFENNWMNKRAPNYCGKNTKRMMI
ncbi:unnamed protein product [Auanema sp. JU1783]|nr:unnamed protein product [Auanema sp. JU1783]